MAFSAEGSFRSMRARRWLLTTIAAWILAAPAGAETPPALRALIVKYRCPIYDRLARIHDSGDPASDRNRYLVATLPDGHYVQCMIHDHTAKFYCEAASGFFEAKEGETRTAYLPKAAIAGLARLGFSTDDRRGNFSLDRAIGNSPDYRALADLILSALYVAYDARAAMDLRLDAPFAPLPGSTCDALS